MRAARAVGDNYIIAADAQSERSGCSIDRMFGTLRALEQQLGVQILDSNRVFVRDENVRALPRAEFARNASLDTVVFDTTAEQLGAIRTGAWERSAAPALAAWRGTRTSPVRPPAAWLECGTE